VSAALRRASSGSLLDGIAELLGDKAYDSSTFRKSLRTDGIEPVIPGRSNRKKRILALVVRGFRFWDNMASVPAPG
jgi:hypothetical protein